MNGIFILLLYLILRIFIPVYKYNKCEHKMEQTGHISFRTVPEVINMLKKAVSFDKRTQASETRFIFELGLKERLKEIAIERYINNDATLEEAASIAEVSIYEMIDLLNKRKVPYNLDVKAVIESAE